MDAAPAVTAAATVADVGVRKLPDLFSSIASPSPAACAAADALTPTYAMHPVLHAATIPGLLDALPSPATLGHVTDVPFEGPFAQAVLVALRNDVNRKVSPELPWRTSGRMVVDGRVTPELRAAIAGSFHFVIEPS